MAKKGVIPNPHINLEPLTEHLKLMSHSTQIEQTLCTEHSTLSADQEITALELPEEDPLLLQLARNLEDGWRRSNTIHKILSQEGHWISNAEGIANDVVHYFQNMFRQNSSSQPAIKDTLFDKEREFTKSLSLTNIPDEKEIWEALNSIDSTKVAGPDGFTADFYKKAWPIVKGEVIATVQSFFWGLTSLNTFPLLPLLWNQSAFIRDRSIVDNVLLAQELVLDLDRITRGGNLILKLDIKKAYDTISGKFIERVLIARGFSPSFVSLINRWLTNNFHSIFINGSSHGFFSASRGIKQGDPLSPTIFILAFDYLSRSLNELASRKPHSLYSHRSSTLINHLAFVDDIIIFSKASKAVVKLFMQNLESFQDVSGMKLNKQKCISNFSKQCKNDLNTWVTDFIGFKNSYFPMKYLGAFLIKGRAKNIQFDHIIDKVQSKLQAWENSFLSNGGKITLLKSVLSAIPSYLRQMNILKKSSQRLLEGIFNRFLWAGQRKQKHWTSWAKVCKPHEEGGLGFKFFPQIMHTNFCKLWFKFRSQSSLWAEFLWGKYCKHQHPTQLSMGLGDSPIWKRMLQVRKDAEQLYVWEIGEGLVNIWWDNWSLDVCLLQDLIAPASSLLVKDIWNHDKWNLTPILPFCSPSQLSNIQKLFVKPGVKDRIAIKKNSFSSKPPQLVGLRGPSRCTFSQSQEETITHLFFACPWVQEVWSFVNSKLKTPTMYLTWKFEAVLEMGPYLKPHIIKILEIFWTLPKLGWTKANTDGSYKSQSAGIDGVFKNHEGRCILFFQSPVKVLDSHEAECQAVFWAITLARSCHFDQL
ncbi:uncharacterized protein LOC110028584 [Phalaenopsis equestris]|uniref:uncharacterized protein LOC110028584 n=1 Tax=Phalaenopsis equestris TaxID=78828 RepID=UPI0009E4D590|nr:uncharacterized protein LOC110028584 [Phalaenopsis equestris]